MAQLVDMKNDATDYEEGQSMLGYSDAGDQPVYPWNMRLSLTDRDLKRLGIVPPAAGSKMMLTASVEVTGQNTNEMKDMKTGEIEKETCCDLTITAMALEPEGQAPKTTAQTLYGKNS